MGGLLPARLQIMAISCTRTGIRVARKHRVLVAAPSRRQQTTPASRTHSSATRALVGTAAQRGLPTMKKGGAATAGSQSTQEDHVGATTTSSLATPRHVRQFLRIIVVPTTAILMPNSSSFSLSFPWLLFLLAPLGVCMAATRANAAASWVAVNRRGLRPKLLWPSKPKSWAKLFEGVTEYSCALLQQVLNEVMYVTPKPPKGGSFETNDNWRYDWSGSQCSPPPPPPP